VGLEAKITFDEQRIIYAKEIYPTAPIYRKRIIEDDEVIQDSFLKLEQLGIFLLRFPSKSNNLSGFHIKKSNFDCVYINSDTSLGRQYFSCWHEYYHAITGEGSGISFFDKVSTDKIECKADLFAGYILMPENLIEKYINTHNINLEKLTYENIIDLQHYFNVSYKAVIKRLQVIYGNINNASKLYELSSKENPHKLFDYTVSMGYSGELLKRTRDIYIPPNFIEDLEINLRNKRINEVKKKSIEDFIDFIKNVTQR
jgi:Zn-dependent peptidase ImmA (M78 family)